MVWRTWIVAVALCAAVLGAAGWPGSGGVARAATNPFAGIRWYQDPDSAVVKQAAEWRATRPADAALLDVIAREQTVEWFGGWYPDAIIGERIDGRVTPITAAGGVPILALYNIPYRDCGLYSAGGANDPDHYRAWIGKVAHVVGQRKVVYILEPDGLTVTFCLDERQRAERYALIGEAVTILKQHNPNAAVYIDGGENGRTPITKIAPILTAANIAAADGFFLNSSVYEWTSTEIAYGRAVSALVGGKHFVIDTSRNGVGPLGREWCNAAGRALGPPPATVTGEPLADAFLWIKPMWESDGHCERGEPDPGVKNWDYALGLVRRSLQPFADLPVYQPGRANEEWVTATRALALRGVIRGNGDGTMGANDTTLRAQMAALIARPVGWELERAPAHFPDQGAVDDALWRNVGILAHYGVAKGFPDGTYGPAEEVTHGQVILFISRAMVARGYWTAQPDDPALYPNLPRATAQEQADRRDIATYVHHTAAAGGVPDRPATGAFVGWGEPASRAWFAVALYRALLGVAL
jgi:endoglucanase